MTLITSNVVKGTETRVGRGFLARRYRATDFNVDTSPFLLMDDYVMSAETFGSHPHHGISTVTMAFEDTVGEVISRDSTGKSTPIRAGDLHWTLSGRGIVHSQEPESAGVVFRGLQIFVDLPKAQKNLPPDSWYVEAGKIPTIEKDGVRVRVVAGRHDDVQSPSSTPTPMTALDVSLTPGSRFDVPLTSGWSALLLVRQGRIVQANGTGTLTISRDEACTFILGEKADALSLKAIEKTELVLLMALKLQ
ncbi:pirin family protein [Pseudomonas aeruginosa]